MLGELVPELHSGDLTILLIFDCKENLFDKRISLSLVNYFARLIDNSFECLLDVKLGDQTMVGSFEILQNFGNEWVLGEDNRFLEKS